MAQEVWRSTIEVSQCRLRLARPITSHEAPPLCALFGRQFEDEVLMHSHGPDGKPIYQYPRVQFKVLDSVPVLIGINEGSQLLQRLWMEFDQAKLGSEQLSVLEAQFETRTEQLEVAAEPITYSFVTPWLALNQKNFHSYVGSRNQRFRKEELSRILVGNCLGLAKSLDIRFPQDAWIEADCKKLTSIKIWVSGQGMIGFVGKFTVNLAIPNNIGLGKSVSRGFGTIISS